jgi:hypothetical protein
MGGVAIAYPFLEGCIAVMNHRQCSLAGMVIKNYSISDRLIMENSEP